MDTREASETLEVESKAGGRVRERRRLFREKGVILGVIGTFCLPDVIVSEWDEAYDELWDCPHTVRGDVHPEFAIGKSKE